MTQERSSEDVVIEGETWRFVVYENGAYTLINPSGTPVPPMDHLTHVQIAAYRLAADGTVHDAKDR